MTAPEPYQRNAELRRRINEFMQTSFGLPADDYYARLNATGIIALKSALSDINNAVTMQLSFGFLTWASKRLPIDATAIAAIRSNLLKSKPGSNGYDLVCTEHVPFVAEVKCNIPVNGGTKYGAQQKAGILKDVSALKNGKTKAGRADPGSLKFMVFLDVPQVRTANVHLVSTTPGLARDLRSLASDELPSDPDVVYAVYANLES